MKATYDASEPRNPEYQNKIFPDEKGVPCTDTMYRYEVSPKDPDDMECTIIQVKNGLLHGSPAICYHDGLEEEWENGVFIKTLELPYNYR